MNVSADHHHSHAATSALTGARRLQASVVTGMPVGTASSTQVVRILVPINANDDSRWGVHYAMQRQLGGKQIEVILLNIGEPINQWQVLRFRGQQEISQFQSERAQVFIEQEARRLTAANIGYRGLFKQGDVVYSILDTAEELACDEIAMPVPKKGLPRLLSRDVVDAVIRQQRGIRVVTVNSEGVVSSN